jgi:hypothetical protein
MDRYRPMIGRSLSDLGNRSENSAGRGQILLILQGNSSLSVKIRVYPWQILPFILKISQSERHLKIYF